MSLLPLPLLHLLVALIAALGCTYGSPGRLSAAVWSFTVAFASTVLGMWMLQWLYGDVLNPLFIAVYTLQGTLFAVIAPLLSMLLFKRLGQPRRR